MQYMIAGLVADFESTCLDAKSLDPRDARSWAERGNKKPARRARGPALSPAGQANLTGLGYSAEQHGDSVGCLARLGTRTYLPCGSTEAERLPDGRRPCCQDDRRALKLGAHGNTKQGKTVRR